MKEQPIDKLQQIPSKRSLSSPDREAARAKLRDAGVLVNDLVLPADLAPVSEEDLEPLGIMRAGARPSEEIMAEDRGR